MMQEGERVWATYDMVDVDSGVFPELGAAFETANPGLVQNKKLGQAACKLIPMQPLIRFGTGWVGVRRREDRRWSEPIGDK